jgi:hypothetical protein
MKAYQHSAVAIVAAISVVLLIAAPCMGLVMPHVNPIGLGNPVHPGPICSWKCGSYTECPAGDIPCIKRWQQCNRDCDDQL